jgi:hypothetical protein
MQPFQNDRDSADIGVRRRQLALPDHQHIGRAGSYRAVGSSVGQGDRIELQRHSHIGSAPCLVGPVFGNIGGQLRASDLPPPVLRIDSISGWKRSTS